MESLQMIRKHYGRLFSVREIEEHSILQWFFGAMLFFFFLRFGDFIGSSAVTRETAERGAALCWPYFQECSVFYLFQNIPEGYSQSIFYMFLYGVMLLVVWCMWKRDWVVAHGLLLFLFLWKAFLLFLVHYSLAGPYDYYHTILTAVLLFVPFKEFFLKLSFVFMYFMSVTVKFDETWVLGTYFTAMKTGLPIFPDALTPLFTNLVIFSQVVACWYLLSRNWILQRATLTFFVVFHLYSGILVYYLYPSVSLPPLLILFGPMYRHTPIPFSKKAVAGWCVILFVALFQLIGFLIPTDRRLSLEGNRYGMFMFEANHQCVATVRIFSKSSSPVRRSVSEIPAGQSCSGFYCQVRNAVYPSESGEMVQESVYESPSAWNRCDPHMWWSRYHSLCERRENVSRVALTFDHSINGGPFYRIVDTENVCDLSYRAFGHNEWIKLPPEAPVVGGALQNVYQY